MILRDAVQAQNLFRSIFDHVAAEWQRVQTLGGPQVKCNAKSQVTNVYIARNRHAQTRASRRKGEWMCERKTKNVIGIYCI